MLPFTGFFHSCFKQCSDFLLPPVCLSCHVPTDRHNVLCGECWSQINFITAPYCNRLGVPLPYHVDGPMISAQALVDPPVYDHARSVASFDGPMRRLVHAFKYTDRCEALSLFARWMAHSGRDILAEADLLVPVPLHRWRLWSRRFNQAAFLAQALSQTVGIATDPFVLQRRKVTKSQVGLTFKQRKRNVSGAFCVAKAYQKRIHGRKIVLIDDVLTSGATVDACVKVLKKAQAREVNVLTLARVIDLEQATF